MAEDNVNQAPSEETACAAPSEEVACQAPSAEAACQASPEGVYQAPSEDQIVAALTGKFPDIVIRGKEARRVYATADRSFSWDVCKYIHDFLTFEHCSTVIGVDYIDHLTVVYHLTNYYNGVMVELSVDVPVDDPHIQSVACIWEGANWHERETWELFGIVFDGHPKLERLLTPQTYEFHPFRKSYKLRGWERCRTPSRRSSKRRRSSRTVSRRRWTRTRCGSSWVRSTRSPTDSGP